jgi:hypothetical protein
MLQFINAVTYLEEGTEGARPNTSFALLGYPRSRKNGGHSRHSRLNPGG